MQPTEEESSDLEPTAGRRNQRDEFVECSGIVCRYRETAKDSNLLKTELSAFKHDGRSLFNSGVKRRSLTSFFSRS